MFIIVFQILGGAGLLLYGIEIMKDSLEWISESRGQRLLEMSGKSTLRSILAGIVVTGINQKSTATTIMVVGMVNAGMISLVQAAGVIMGANIGTTITAQLLAFRLELFAPCIVGIAVIFWKYSVNKRFQYMAEIFIGFGIMFIGMIFIEMGLAPLKGLTAIENFIVSFAQPYTFAYLILIFIGFIITSVVRSSSLLTGIMIAMAAQGILPLEMAIPIILGLNVGKCMTAIWDSRDAGRTAKRAAIIHLLFNLFGTIVVVVLLQGVIVDIIKVMSPDNLPRQIANAHTLFNLGATILCLPFIKLFVKITDRMIPKKREEKESSNLDVRMLDTPGIALAQTYNEIISLTKISLESYVTSINCVEKDDLRAVKKIKEMKDNILRSQKDIEAYLVKLAQKNISKEQHEMLNLMLGVTGDIERISDTSITIANFAGYKKNNKIQFSKEAQQEIYDFHKRIYTIFEEINEAMVNNDTILANSILSAEIKIKEMETIFRDNHIERLSKCLCNPESGVLYIDLINSMEHVAQHIKKIGFFVIAISKY